MKKLSDMRSTVSLACSTEAELFAEHRQSNNVITGNHLYTEFDEQLMATTASSLSPSSARAFKVRSESPFDGVQGGGSSGQEIDTSLSRCSLTHLQQLRVVPRMGTRAVVGGAYRSRPIGENTCRFGTGSRSMNDGKTFQSSSSSAHSLDGATDDSVSSDSFDSELCLVDEVEFYRRHRFSSSDRDDDFDVTDTMVGTTVLGGQSSSESSSSLSELYPVPTGATNENPWQDNTHLAADGRRHRLAIPDMKPSSAERVRQLGPQPIDEKIECRQVPTSKQNDNPRLSTTMVTNRAHLAHTILVQQRLFQQQMIAVQRRQKQQYLQQCNSHEAVNKSDYWTSTTFEHHYEEIEDLKSSPPLPPQSPVEVTEYRAPTVHGSPSVDRRWVSSAGGKSLSRASPSCSGNSIRQSRDSRDGRNQTRDSARAIQDQQLSPGQLRNYDEKLHDLDSTYSTDWVVKRRPDGTRYIARRSKKTSPSAAPSGDFAGLRYEDSHMDKTLSRDIMRSRRDQPSNDSMKPETETLRQRELRAAIFELLPASEKRPAVCVTDSPISDDVGPIVRSHRALLSVTTM